MLYYSSFLILFPIFYGQGTFLGILYTLLLGVSILNHAKKKDNYHGKQLVELIDKIIVYAIACTQVHYAFIYANTDYQYMLMIYWSCFAYVIYNYCYKRRTIHNETELIINHVKFHIACIIGGMSIMFIRKNSSI